ncbi:MAG: hypothetical protein LiPW41_785 [Parcubacteria group bacterium LiPW_41]|nr:MAG: hypothetical protein LiPW41_785 [Parcubacteria group bacterium LiPW_41]
MGKWAYETICPACLNEYSDINIEHQKTKHHILPKRFFGGGGGQIELCRSCHNDLEKEIPQKKVLSQNKYVEIIKNFFKKRNQDFKIPHEY